MISIEFFYFNRKLDEYDSRTRYLPVIPRIGEVVAIFNIEDVEDGDGYVEGVVECVWYGSLDETESKDYCEISVTLEGEFF